MLKHFLCNKWYLPLLTAVALLGACDDTDTVDWNDVLDDDGIGLKISDITFDNDESDKTTLLVSETAWSIPDVESIPEWLTVQPTSGNGNAIIRLHVSENKLVSSRNAEIHFVSQDLDGLATLKITQKGNSDVQEQYSYLGDGYDAAGRYAEEVSIKGRVLDIDKLIENDFLAEVLNSNSTVEEVVTGKTLSEYENNFSVTAGLEGEIAGFKSSVKSNFSQKALGTAEYSFATLRHITKKQIYKIFENVKAEDLKQCLSSQFIKDMESVLTFKGDASMFDIKVNGLLDKYGTHVVTGFSLGGVLEYSMAADASSMEETVEWGLAVEAGFEKEGTGKISASSSTEQLDRLKNQSSGFESKLLCRGGESQYASSGYGEDAGKTAATYGEWLSSLSEESKWVMVAFEGSKLVPLYDFVDDATLKEAIERLSKDRLTGLSGEVKSDYKQLEIKLVSMWSNHDDAGEESEWRFKLVSTVDQKPSMRRTIYETTSDVEIPENSEYSLEYLNATSGVYKISISQSHDVTINLSDCKEIDTSGDDVVKDATLKLHYAPTEGWSYLGMGGDEYNQTVIVDDTHTTLKLYSTVGDDSQVRFTFQATWK